MFKKLFICLALIVALVLPLNVSALENDQQCTLIEGAKVIQILPDQSLRGVINPEEMAYEIGPKLTPEAVIVITRATKENEWEGAHMGMVTVDFGAGSYPCMIIVRPQYVKDCK